VNFMLPDRTGDVARLDISSVVLSCPLLLTEPIGRHHLYGILEHPNTLPIGMAEDTPLIKPKKKDEPIGWEEVQFPGNDPRLELWNDQIVLEE